MIEPLAYRGFNLYQSYGPTVDVWQAFMPDGRSVAMTTLEGCKRAVDAFLDTSGGKTQ